MKPEEVVQEVKESGVRGRGGAGFPTGLNGASWPKVPVNPVIWLPMLMNLNQGPVRIAN